MSWEDTINDEGYSDTPQEDEQQDTAALSCDLLFKTQLPRTLPCPVGQRKEDLNSKFKPKAVCVSSSTWCPKKQRLYVGLSNGDLCFWPLHSSRVSELRYVGTHKGPVTCICLPKPSDGDLGSAGLILSGSVDGNIKIWDYQGKVAAEPTICVQTLYGHSSTVTGLGTYNAYIISSSTDCSVKVWKAVEGRDQLVYPWYTLQSTPVTLTSWIRCMSYDRSKEVGDLGTFFAVDDAGGMISIVPQYVQENLPSSCGLSKGLQFIIPGYNSQHPSSPGTAAHEGQHKQPGLLPHTIPVSHDRGVLKIRYVAEWHVVLSLAYDNCLRAADSDTGEIKHVFENERKCLFLDLEVDVQGLEVLVVDQQGVLSVFSLRAGALLATKTVTQGPATRICAVLARHTYAIMTDRDMAVWYLNHELGYNVLRGGHTKAVIALYACTGGTGASPGQKDHRIFSAGLDMTVRLWDPYDMSCARVLSEDGSEITAMTFYEAWHILVTGHDDGIIKLWDPDTGPWCTLKQHTNTVSCLTMALIRKNEELLISGGYDGVIVLWDIRTLRNEPPHMVARFQAHGAEPVKSPGLVSSAAQVAAASPLLGAAGTQATERKMAGTPVIDEDDVTAVIPSLRPLYDVSCSSLGTNLSESSQIQDPGEHTTLQIVPTKPSASSALTTVSKSVRQTTLKASPRTTPGSTPRATPRGGNPQQVNGGVLTQPRRSMLDSGITAPASSSSIQNGSAQRSPSALSGGFLNSNSVSSSSRVQSFFGGSGVVLNMGSNNQKQDLAQVGINSQISGSVFMEAQHAHHGTSSLVSPDPRAGSQIDSTAATQQQLLALSDPASRALLALSALEPEILAIVFDPLKKVLMTAGNDKAIKVWSMHTYSPLGQHLGHTEPVASLTLDANLLFSGSEDGSIRVWDAVPAPLTSRPEDMLDSLVTSNNARSTAGAAGGVDARTSIDGRPMTAGGFTSSSLKVLHGHTRCVTGLAVSSGEGGHLVSCSLDGSTRLWDYVEGTCLARFNHHEEMRCLALRSDKPEVLVGTQQASILRFSITDVPSVEAGSRALHSQGTGIPKLHLHTTEGDHADQQGLESLCLDDTPLITTSTRGDRDSEHFLTDRMTTRLSCGSEQQRASSGFHKGPSFRSESQRVGTAGSLQQQSARHTDASCVDGDSRMTTTELGVPVGPVMPVVPGRVFGSKAGVSGLDAWRWGAIKVQILPKEPPKLSAEEMLSQMDKLSKSQTPQSLRNGMS